MQNLGKKLQVKPDHKLLLLNAPEEVAQTLSSEGYTFATQEATGEKGTFDAVQLFVKSRAELERDAPQAIEALKPAGMLWIAYPKKSSKITSDLTRDEGWQAVADMGYEGVRQIAIDDTWSSMRFKQAAERKEPSMFGVDYPGIDRKTKTVTIPEDLREALEAVGLLESFEKLAFTNRKEIVVAILDAKRPETRASRIGKTIEQLMGLSLGLKL
ncbi:YdeI/OmpD-associated family protein [Pontibacter ruber]|uniref:YdeI/OmpD-associated family protein n=1 Tax=Pontibacter ruber TaxID=1343895 RepID=A0ABW5CWR3_9BACT|nr:YdeI/OmpD-associated family protein [Pontibacter ruber]